MKYRKVMSFSHAKFHVNIIKLQNCKTHAKHVHIVLFCSQNMIPIAIKIVHSLNMN